MSYSIRRGLLGFGSAPLPVKVSVGVVSGTSLASLAAICTSLLKHRNATHDAFKLDPRVRVPIKVFDWIATGMVERQWVAVHRKHHRDSDTVNDPHSPLHKGKFQVLFNMFGLYKQCLRENPNIVEDFASDIEITELDRLLFDKALLGLGTGIGSAIVVFGTTTGAVLIVTHAGLYLLFGGIINGVCHLDEWAGRVGGFKNYGNEAMNVNWLSWLIGGEPLHNNHHGQPDSAQFAHRPGEFDPTWKVIVWLERHGLASNVRRARPDMHSV